MYDWVAASKISGVFLILTLVWGVLPVYAAGPEDINNPAEFEIWCDEFISQQIEDHHIPGATVAVVKDGELLLARGWGYADLDHNTPVDPEHTLFRIASITKLFTWTAVMQLVERGVLRLDADVNDYLTDFQIPSTFPQPITLAHLMAHTAGFEDRGIGTLGNPTKPIPPLSDYLAQHMPARVRPPGEVSMYSNYGAALAGYIVARATGETYEEYIETQILQPLAMDFSSIRQPVPEYQRSNLAQSYAFIGGNYRPTSFAIDLMAPAGAMSASATDMAHFMLAHLQGGRYGEVQLLSEATTLDMHAQSFTHHPQLPGWAHGFQEMDINGRRVIFHDGSLQNYVSLLLLSPENDLGLFVAYNSYGGGAALDEFLQAFFDRYYPASTDSALQPVGVAATPAKQLAGSYQTMRKPYTTIEVLSRNVPVAKLSVAVDGTLSFLGRDWTQVEPLLYQASEGGDLLAFLTNDKGQVTGAALGTLALAKLQWHELSQVRLAAALVCLLLLLSGIIGWPVAALIRRLHAKEPLEPSARFSRWFAGSAAVLAILDIVALIVNLGQPLIYGAPPILRVLTLVPYIIAALALGTLLLAIQSWRKRNWNILTRVHYSLVVLGLVGLVWLMRIYNLFGSGQLNI